LVVVYSLTGNTLIYNKHSIHKNSHINIENMTQIKAINAQQLRSFCSQAEFDFKTTSDLASIEAMVGQARALEAISLAVEIKRPVNYMYFMGYTWMGKHA